MAQQFWVRTEQGVFGPYALQQLHEMAADGRLQHHHQVSIDQFQWLPAGGFRGLQLQAPPPPPASADPGSARMTELLDEVEQEQSQRFAQQTQDAMQQRQLAGRMDFGAEKAAKYMRQAQIAAERGKVHWTYTLAKVLTIVFVFPSFSVVWFNPNLIFIIIFSWMYRWPLSLACYIVDKWIRKSYEDEDVDFEYRKARLGDITYGDSLMLVILFNNIFWFYVVCATIVPLLPLLLIPVASIVLLMFVLKADFVEALVVWLLFWVFYFILQAILIAFFIFLIFMLIFIIALFGASWGWLEDIRDQIKNFGSEPEPEEWFQRLQLSVMPVVAWVMARPALRGKKALAVRRFAKRLFSSQHHLGA